MASGCCLLGLLSFIIPPLGGLGTWTRSRANRRNIRISARRVSGIEALAEADALSPVVAHWNAVFPRGPWEQVKCRLTPHHDGKA